MRETESEKETHIKSIYTHTRTHNVIQGHWTVSVSGEIFVPRQQMCFFVCVCTLKTTGKKTDIVVTYEICSDNIPHELLLFGSLDRETERAKKGARGRKSVFSLSKKRRRKEKQLELECIWVEKVKKTVRETKSTRLLHTQTQTYTVI